MAFTEPGTQGAFRQTWRKDNPRSLLRTLINKHPKADEAKIHQLLWEEIEDDKLLLRACVEYWADHNYNSLKRAMSAEKRPPTPASASASASREALAASVSPVEVAQQMHQRIEHETKLLLLDLIMPNEKRLGDCTGKECRRIGGWLAMLANKVPPTKTVAQTLSEDQVFQVWQRASKK